MKVTPALMRSSLNSRFVFEVRFKTHAKLNARPLPAINHRGKLGKISEATCVQLGVDDKDSRKALIALAKRARTSKVKLPGLSTS